MTFYVKPPDGRLSLPQFHEYAVTRLRFLLALCSSKHWDEEYDFVTNFVALTKDPYWATHSTCLQERSMQDRASHFILHLLICDSHELKSSVLFAESVLFYCRLALLKPSDIKRSLSDLKRHAHASKEINTQSFQPVHETAINIVNQLIAKNLVSHCFSDSGKNCAEHHIEVHYLHVLPLVAQRAVTISKAFAQISCSQVPVLLRLLFEQIMTSSSDFVNMNRVLDPSDSRMTGITRELEAIFRASRLGLHKISEQSFPTTLHVPVIENHSFANTRLVLRSEDIDKVSRFFPPCMKNLHQVLRHRHRLRHNARVQYTLFLKEVGMPLDEALSFWKNEYSKNPCGSHVGCDHHWNRDEKKYEYSLRHMYGLSGSRKNYSGQRCSVLQASCSSSHEGGCPFVFADTDHLRGLVATKSLNDGTWKTILDLRERQRFSSACAEHLRSLRANETEEYDLSKPAHFFFQYFPTLE